jgi:hypothetical protein
VKNGKIAAQKIIIAVIMGLVFVVVIDVLQSGQPQTIPFSVFDEGHSLIVTNDFHHRETDPPLIIIASQDDTNLPSDLEFPEPLADRIRQIDFENSFLILVDIGFPARETVKSVARKQEKVFITTYDAPLGMGNYILEEWTQPYEFIKIDKDDTWGGQFHFILQGVTRKVHGETIHFIP